MITPDRPMMTGKELREIRLRLGLTQEELAARLGYTGGNFISRLECGRARIKPQTAMLAKALDAGRAER